MADLQQLYLERVARERAERRALLGPWIRDRQEWTDREDVSDADLAELESVARTELADDASCLERVRAHRDDRWMREQVWAYHQRGAARERAADAASRAVPGAERYPAAVPGAWPEITR